MFTIGVSVKEFWACLNEIKHTGSPDKMNKIIKKLGFTLEQISIVVEENEKATQVASILWMLKGEEEVPLRDFVETIVVLRYYFRQEPIMG